jgi:hypothetical protein
MLRSMGLLLPLEVTAVALLVLFALWRRGRRAGRPGAHGQPDVPEQIRDALAAAGLGDGVASALSTETAVFYYALAAWKRKPFAPPGMRAFSYHRRNAYAAILYAVFGVALVEMTAVDLVVRASHVTAANVLLAIDVLAAIWLLGFARAVQLRPILLTADALLIRNGLALNVDVPLADATIEFGRVRAPARGTPRYLRATMGQPNALLALRKPATVRRAYGRSRLVDRIGLVLDDPKGFEAAWRSFVPEAPDFIHHM